jgi:hypothetical protein
VGYVAAGAAGVLALLGTGAIVTREWEAGIYNDDSKCAPLGGESRYARCGVNRDIGSAAQTIAVSAFIGTGLSAVLAGVLLLRGTPSASISTAHTECRTVGFSFSCKTTF